MTKSVDFYFDFGSPAAYLAATQLPKIAADAGAALVWKPMLLGGVFQATGNHSPAEIKPKGPYMNRDLARFAKRYGVPFAHNPHFPINTLTLMRGAAGLQMRRPADLPRYLDVIERAMWEQPKNLGDPAVLASTLSQAGFDADEFVAMVGDPEVKARLVATTEAAVARGVFGAPTFFVGDAMFFGQDRLEFVREALLGQRTDAA